MHAAAPVAAEPVEDVLARAIASQQSGRLGQAIRQFRQVLQREPRHAEALRHLGEIQGQIGNIDQGVRLLRQAIAAGSRSAMVHVHLAALLVDAG